MQGIYHVVGVAPSEVTNPGKNWIDTVRNASLPNVVALGETGLDYYRKFGDKRSQIELFITELELAEKHKTCYYSQQDAGADVLDILRAHPKRRCCVTLLF